MKWFVYILLSEKINKTYVGFTSNLVKRLTYHNTGKVSFTSRFAPWRLIYSEEFETKKDAAQREKYFKSSAGRRKIKKIFEELKIN